MNVRVLLAAGLFVLTACRGGEGARDAPSTLTLKVFTNDISRGGGCYFYGRIPAQAFEASRDRADVETIESWELRIEGDLVSLTSKSAVAWLKEPDGTRAVSIGVFTASCPDASARVATLAFSGGPSWLVQLDTSGASLWTLTLQPFVLDHAGLGSEWLRGTYVSEIAACVTKFYARTCRVQVDVLPTLRVPLPQNQDRFFYASLSGDPLMPWVVSRSAQNLAAVVPPGQVGFFLGDDTTVEGTDLTNEALGFTLYEISGELAGTPFYASWAAPQLRPRTDENWGLGDPGGWLTAPASDPARLRLISLQRKRFPVTLPHELGHVFGLPHPEESLEIDSGPGLNVMHQSGFFTAGAGSELAPLYGDSTIPADFDAHQCDKLIERLDISTYQCLIVARDVNRLGSTSAN